MDLPCHELPLTMTDQQIWQWTLTKEAIAPCFVRDVLTMRQSTGRDADFFWLGHTPCRTVLLVGMVVGIQVYDKRTIYTIDDGTAVIDCVLRHRNPTLPAAVSAPNSLPRAIGAPRAKTNLQQPSPKKPRLDKAKPESAEPPPPIAEPGYPVRVVGRVARHFESKQIHADTIDPCPSSLDEITHLERVIELHKRKYSCSVPFVLPPRPISHALSSDTSTLHASANTDTNVFCDSSIPSRPSSKTTSYSLQAPLHSPMSLQNRNRLTPVPADDYHGRRHIPSSPTASSIASSTPSSPCKSSSPVKLHEVRHKEVESRLAHFVDKDEPPMFFFASQAPSKPKLRHPSRLHARDLTANTFRIYLKHYMDNAPPPFPASWSSFPRGTCATPAKRVRHDGDGDESTPRPPPSARHGTRDAEEEDEDRPMLGFTLSHLRRVPELALLAARVVRVETRKRDKANREKERAHSQILSSVKPNESRDTSTPKPQTMTGRGTRVATDPPRKKMARLFSWAVVKLYEEGSIVLWDGDVRPLPVPPLLLPLPQSLVGPWNNDPQRNTVTAPFVPSRVPSTLADSNTFTQSASVLYVSSASAPLYSRYAPRRPSDSRLHQCESSERVAPVDVDADPANLSDPPEDEEAYISLTPRLLARHVSETVSALHRGNGCEHRGPAVNRESRKGGGTGKETTAEEILAYMRRADGRWAKVGVWAVEEALALLKEGRRE